MLRYRICAHCGSTIESPTAYFCYHCGQVVDQKQDAAPLVDTPPLTAITSSSFSFKGRFFLIVLLFFVFLGIGIFYYWLRFGPTLKGGPSTKKVENAVLLQNFHFGVPAFTLEKITLAELTPNAVDFSIFGRHAAGFFTKIISEERLADFKKITGLTVPEAQTYLEEDFAFFREGESFGFLGKVKARDFVEKKVEEVKKSKTLTGYVPYLVGDYLIVTNSRELADLVTATIDKKHLNLSLKASFSEAWRALPHEGQYFIFSNNHDRLGLALTMIFGSDIGAKLTEKIKGNAVLFTPYGAGTLLQGTNNGK